MKCIAVLVVFITVLASCYYDSEENLYPPVDCVTTGISFSSDVAPILDASCNACHSASANLGGINLEGYNSVKQYVQNGKLIGSIRHQSGFSAMPQGAPKLESCKILKIESWINAGSPNN